VADEFEIRPEFFFNQLRAEFDGYLGELELAEFQLPPEAGAAENRTRITRIRRATNLSFS
jgi:hypothetical protein